MGRIKPIKVFREPSERRREVAALLNLGPKSTAWLAAIGVRTREQLAALGPIETCRRLRAAGHPVSVLMAYALEGALTHTHWNELPFETKQWLRVEFAEMKRTAPAPPPTRPARAAK
jgi:DNA transformation protein